MSAPRVAVLIPSYNAAPWLSDVISGAARHIPRSDIVAVDDGSQDHTAHVAAVCGITVLTHPQNRGKGAALKTGFAFALARGYDAVLTIDADGQHDPGSIPALVRAQRATDADIVLGSRMHDLSTMPLHRRCSNTLTSLVISLRTGQSVRDSQSGFRWIRSELLRAIPLTHDGYQLESELLIKALIAGARLAAVPVETIYGGRESFIHPFRDTVRFITLILGSLFWT